MSTSETHDTLARSAGAFTGATLISRILGYVRDTLVATTFGAGAYADAFYAAFRISNLFRRLLGEGALSSAFVPVFTEYLGTQGKKETYEFFQTMFTFLLVLLSIITFLGILGAPQITHLIAGGFANTPDRFALTVSLTRWMFPFLLFISLAALVTGVLNSFKVFFMPALAPMTLSIAEIGYLLALAPFLSMDKRIIGMALSVAVGGLGQLLIQIPSLWKQNITIRWRWAPKHEGLKRVGRLMLPATLGSSVDQLNAFVDTVFASHLALGSVTALYYSNRVMQLPLALFGIALSQVSLPTLSAHVVKKDTEAVKNTLNFALRLTTFMIFPATVGLVILSTPIVRVLFQHGAFSDNGTLLTSNALRFYALGLPAFAMVKILASAFYAHQNTKTPVRVACGCVVLNVIFIFIFMPRWGVGGLAFATTLASTINSIILYWNLRQMLGPMAGRRLLRTALRSVIACIAMGAFCVAVLQWGHFHKTIMLIIAIAGGAGIYLGLARLLQMEEWAPFWAQMSRKAKPPKPTSLSIE